MSEDADRWKKRFERERKARKEAESLLEEKSLQLFNTNVELKRQKDQIERILSNVVSAMLITSKATRKVIYANIEATVQYRASIDEILGSDIDRFYVNLEDSNRIKKRVMEGGEPLYNLELSFKRFDDTVFEGLLSIISIDFNGEPSFLGMVTDITTQKQRESELQRLHKNIRSSIEYASIIQESILPSNDILERNFTNHFIIWQPRDIVGGDIYFFEQNPIRNEVTVMVIDCTGHGVPGAFLTMVVRAIEKQIVEDIIKRGEWFSPLRILNSFTHKLRDTLKGSTRFSSHSGFDGAIISYRPSEGKILFSGANTSLYINRSDEVIEVKGDKRSVGLSCDRGVQFTEKSIDILGCEKLYITTDGYIDQTGGKKGFPFGSRKFKKAISEFSKEEFSKYSELFLERLNSYEGLEGRNDDITVLGLQL
jgi:serine phosphatase RsbU (regulator of sigma subunit)